MPPLYARHALLFKLTLVQNLHGQTLQNGYYFSNKDEMDSNAIQGSLVTLVDTFKNNVLSYIKAFTSQELVYRSIIAHCVVPREGPIVEEILETHAGTQTFESLPSYCAAILTLRSGFGGKSNRGRSFYSGICAGFGTGGQLDNDSFGQLKVLGDQLLNIFGDPNFFSNLNYVIFSRTLSEDPEISEVSDWTKPVKQTIPRRVLGTQRHRKIGIGN
jgi:hypothetical protein